MSYPTVCFNCKAMFTLKHEHREQLFSDVVQVASQQTDEEYAETNGIVAIKSKCPKCGVMYVAIYENTDTLTYEHYIWPVHKAMRFFDVNHLQEIPNAFKFAFNYFYYQNERYRVKPSRSLDIKYLEKKYSDIHNKINVQIIELSIQFTNTQIEFFRKTLLSRMYSLSKRFSVIEGLFFQELEKYYNSRDFDINPAIFKINENYYSIEDTRNYKTVIKRVKVKEL